MKISWKDMRKAYEYACDAMKLEYDRADQAQDKKFWELVVENIYIRKQIKRAK